MTKKRHTIAILALWPVMAQAQQAPLIEWQYNYGGSEVETSHDIVRTSDGGYILTAGTQSDDGDISGHHGQRDIWLVKLRHDGTIDWERCYGGTNHEDAQSTVRETPDGGFIVAGTSSSFDGDLDCSEPSTPRGWVIRVSSTGDIIWQRCLGGSLIDRILSLTPVDGGFVLCGFTTSSDGDAIGNHGQSDMWVMNLDEAGETVWNKCFGGSLSDVGRHVSITSDGLTPYESDNVVGSM